MFFETIFFFFMAGSMPSIQPRVVGPRDVQRVQKFAPMSPSRMPVRYLGHHSPPPPPPPPEGNGGS